MSKEFRRTTLDQLPDLEKDGWRHAPSHHADGEHPTAEGIADGELLVVMVVRDTLDTPVSIM